MPSLHRDPRHHGAQHREHAITAQGPSTPRSSAQRTYHHCTGTLDTTELSTENIPSLHRDPRHHGAQHREHTITAQGPSTPRSSAQRTYHHCTGTLDTTELSTENIPSLHRDPRHHGAQHREHTITAQGPSTPRSSAQRTYHHCTGTLDTTELSTENIPSLHRDPRHHGAQHREHTITAQGPSTPRSSAQRTYHHCTGTLDTTELSTENIPSLHRDPRHHGAQHREHTITAQGPSTPRSSAQRTYHHCTGTLDTTELSTENIPSLHRDPRHHGAQHREHTITAQGPSTPRSSAQRTYHHCTGTLDTTELSTENIPSLHRDPRHHGAQHREHTITAQGPSTPRSSAQRTYHHCTGTLDTTELSTENIPSLHRDPRHHGAQHREHTITAQGPSTPRSSAQRTYHHCTGTLDTTELSTENIPSLHRDPRHHGAQHREHTITAQGPSTPRSSAQRTYHHCTGTLDTTELSTENIPSLHRDPRHHGAQHREHTITAQGPSTPRSSAQRTYHHCTGTLDTTELSTENIPSLHRDPRHHGAQHREHTITAQGPSTPRSSAQRTYHHCTGTLDTTELSTENIPSLHRDPRHHGAQHREHTITAQGPSTPRSSAQRTYHHCTGTLDTTELSTENIPSLHRDPRHHGAQHREHTITAQGPSTPRSSAQRTYHHCTGTLDTTELSTENIPSLHRDPRHHGAQHREHTITAQGPSTPRSSAQRTYHHCTGTLDTTELSTENIPSLHRDPRHHGAQHREHTITAQGPSTPRSSAQRTYHHCTGTLDTTELSTENIPSLHRDPRHHGAQHREHTITAQGPSTPRSSAQRTYHHCTGTLDTTELSTENIPSLHRDPRHHGAQHREHTITAQGPSTPRSSAQRTYHHCTGTLDTTELSTENIPSLHRDPRHHGAQHREHTITAQGPSTPRSSAQRTYHHCTGTLDTTELSTENIPSLHRDHRHHGAQHREHAITAQGPSTPRSSAQRTCHHCTGTIDITELSTGNMPSLHKDHRHHGAQHREHAITAPESSRHFPSLLLCPVQLPARQKSPSPALTRNHWILVERPQWGSREEPS
ncbi:hypothetical protein MDA_GLEAN10018950 [Myotis davidii]|uniref:Uncharacterized protein n=1 Tax=Myotis davidii TaxID=225400 RepID=L5LZR7_MYODS|nr:hypothetical protein MDA_GLEAN10018950 [Myotis davidii]